MKSFIFVFFLFTHVVTLLGIAPNGFFSHFSNPVFVETGTWVGEGIDQALNDGFQEVRSIEIDPRIYENAKNKFRNDPRVHLYCGDSGEKLYDIIKDVQTPITFWLDGHYSGPGTGKGKCFSPIIQELEQIKRHPIKSHTIIIDDVRQMGTVDFDYTTYKEIIDLLLEINPQYEIRLYDGFTKNDILVCRLNN